jgi:glycerophosphoryl diester phosphodiesterase
MLIIAHRGASKDAPENTVAAFKLGWEQHADAVELDIWRTKDGRILASHDESTHRTTGVGKKISECTQDELRGLDAGSWKGLQWKGEKLPTLEEALATIPGSGRLVIEIKCGAEVLPELQRVIEAAGKPASQLALICFGLGTCTDAKQRFPDVSVWLLASVEQDKQSGAWKPAAAELVGKAKSAGLDGIDIGFKSGMDAAYIREIRTAGLKVFVWTVDDATVARGLQAAGVDGITTNRPGWLREQLRAT